MIFLICINFSKASMHRGDFIVIEFNYIGLLAIFEKMCILRNPTDSRMNYEKNVFFEIKY